MRTEGARLLATKVTPQVSQASVARLCGVTQQAVSSWVTGRGNPTPINMAKIEELLGIPMRSWTREAEEANAEANAEATSEATTAPEVA